MKKYKLFYLAAIILIGSVNLLAQTNSDETQKIKLRAENFLQTVREEKWDETYKFVAFIVHKDGKSIRKRLDAPENFDEEIKKQIAERFRKLYTAPKPGKTARVTIYGKDKTVALIEYMHEDLDGFNMILVDDQWYYAIDIYK